METLSAVNALQARAFLVRAAEAAKESKCRKAHCGAIVVTDGRVIGRGYNAPPQDRRDLATCVCPYNTDSAKPRYDQTCCLHAEWRAILDAVSRGVIPNDASLFFLRLCADDSWADDTTPYCTVCSRLMLDVGIARVLMPSGNRVISYSTEDFYRLSYEFHSRRYDGMADRGAARQMS